MTKQEFNDIGFYKGMNIIVDSPHEYGVFDLIGVDFDKARLMIANGQNHWVEIEYCSLA